MIEKMKATSATAEEEAKMIKDNNEIIRKEMEAKGFVENPGQIFDDAGRMEATAKRVEKIIKHLMLVLKENKVESVVVRSLLSTSNMNPASLYPILSFNGEQVVVKFVVPPTDKLGNWGQKWVSKEEAEKWKKDD